MSEQKRAIRETGFTNCDVAAQVGGVHVLGGLHGHPLTIARLTGSITRYEPDVVAVEACAEAISQYHPDVQDARWPPRDELEAAAYATDRLYDLLLAGIDTRESEHSADFERFDREIFTELGIIGSPDELTRATYYELDLETIREWRALTEVRAPDAFTTVLAERDAVMAGHLHALVSDEDIDTIVAMVGVQHLTGVVDLLRTPSEIPDDFVEIPPLAHYRLFPRDSPWSSAK
ncbi:TraB/GumN family protein [Halalkaliarchaeum desulfuricum]|nr:hypothetical protein [Halalkaliarchaeum desulfuricum]